MFYFEESKTLARIIRFIQMSKKNLEIWGAGKLASKDVFAAWLNNI